MSRWQLLEQTGAVVWMTGLPASGKSSIAHAVEESLLRAGRSAYVLDGDNLRHGLNGDLGFSDEDRAENVRRTAHVARLLADAGTVAIVSLVSPFAADREQARALVEAEGLPFHEVWVSTPVEECERRDPKGLYAKARAGDLPRLHRRRRPLRGATVAGPRAGCRPRRRGGGRPGHPGDRRLTGLSSS